MAIVADLSDIDLVVEPHVYTDEDLEAFRMAVEQCRKSSDASQAIEEANRILSRRITNRRERRDV